MTCQETLNALLPSPLPMVLGFPESATLSDTSLEYGLTYYLANNAAMNCLIGNRYFPQFMPEKNTTYPAIVYSVSRTEYYKQVSNSGGNAVAAAALTIWSSKYTDVIQVAEALRLCLHGFRGWMGCVGVSSCFLDGQDDENEQPQDSSGTWWFRRVVNVTIRYYEAIPTF